MAGTMLCPSCQQSVQVAGHTCASCGAVFADPNLEPTEPPPTSRLAGVCPRCHKPVEAVWLFCPNCEERLKDTRDGPIRSGTAAAELGTTVQKVLACIGLIPFLFFVAIIPASILSLDWDNAFRSGLFFGGLCFLGVIIGVRRAWDRGDDVRTWSVLVSILAVFGLIIPGCIASMIFGPLISLTLGRRF